MRLFVNETVAKFATWCAPIAASLTCVLLLACAAQTDQSASERLQLSETLSTAIAARDELTPAASDYATAQAASDMAEAALEDAIAKSQRLSTVFEHGHVICGVHPDRVGLSMADQDGLWSGFFVDMCRAVSATLFGTTGRVQFVSIEVGDEGEALREGEIDILATDVDWTWRRENTWGNATLPVYFGGQSVIVRRDSDVNTFADLSGVTVCTIARHASEREVLAWARDDGINLATMQFASLTDAISAYELGFCHALTDSVPELSVLISQLDTPSDHRILRGYFNERQAVLAVPHGSDEWFDVVKFVVTGLVQADMLGVTSENIADARASQEIAVRRLAGYEGDFGQSALFLGARVLQSVIQGVGNYGEIYDRHFGPDALDIDRGRNRLTRDGGSIWAPPLR